MVSKPHIKHSIFFAAFAIMAFTLPVQAQQLDVPVIEYAEEDLDTCGYGQVQGLKKGGDGFLAVRSGPGGKYRKLGELKNGENFWIFEQRGKWVGIVYDNPNLSCSPIKKDRPVSHKGKKGWVHQKWAKLIAG